MQNNESIDKILDRRSFQNSNFDILNSKIINFAKTQPQKEFKSSIVKVSNSAKIILLAACFVLGIFTSFNLEAEAISNDFIEYAYVEEGII
jgi:hypothetical protein